MEKSLTLIRNPLFFLRRGRGQLVEETDLYEALQRGPEKAERAPRTGVRNSVPTGGVPVTDVALSRV